MLDREVAVLRSHHQILAVKMMNTTRSVPAHRQHAVHASHPEKERFAGCPRRCIDEPPTCLVCHGGTDGATPT